MGESVECEEYVRYRICKDFHMDYHTYEQQPPFFIEQILLFMKQESENMKQKDTPRSSGYKLQR